MTKAEVIKDVKELKDDIKALFHFLNVLKDELKLIKEKVDGL